MMEVLKMCITFDCQQGVFQARNRADIIFGFHDQSWFLAVKAILDSFDQVIG
jgi:hypothetical protein